MKVSRNWLQTYFKDPLPPVDKITDALTMHAFEIESVEKKGEDYVLDVKVLPNRAHDCLSHYGIAKEISTILHLPLSRNPFENSKPLEQTTDRVKISVETKDLKRFSTALVLGVKVGPSPRSLRERLEAVGQKSINNIVDATNYVMFDIGQPLHAFDMDKLSLKGDSAHILVRNTRGGERVTALDSNSYELPENAVIIADGNETDSILGIAGVKGGKVAEIDDTTTNIILESATFSPQSIRKTSKTLRLRTEASLRFENEIAPELPGFALPAVVKLILDIAGGKFGGYAEQYPRARAPYKTGVALSQINALLGTALSQKETEIILSRLHIPFELVDPRERVVSLGKSLVGKSYTYGASVSYDAPNAFDCSSLTSHLYSEAGYSIPRVSIDQLFYGDEIDKKDLRPGDLVFSKGSSEVKTETQGFMRGKKFDAGVGHVGIFLGDEKILHASGSRGEVLIEGLAESPDFKHIVGYRRVISTDEKRFVTTIPFERLDLENSADLIEEVGRIHGLFNIPSTYTPHSGPLEIDTMFYYGNITRQKLAELGFSEVLTYVMRDSGRVEIQNPIANNKAFMRDSLKNGLLTALEFNGKNAPLLGLEEIRIFELGKVFSTGGEKLSLGLGIYIPKNIKDKESVTRKKLEEAVRVIEEILEVPLEPAYDKNVAIVDFESVVEKLPVPSKYTDCTLNFPPRYRAPSLYPFVLRDIAVFVPEDISSGEVSAVLEKEAGELLVRLSLFDEFKKEGKVSYAFRLVFQSHEKTLSDDEVNAVMSRVAEAIHAHENWQVR